MNFRSKHNRVPDQAIEITPLVDCVFLLLIFFLLTATYVRNPNLDVRLPRATVQQLSTQKRDIVVGITARGDLRYEGKRTNLRGLRSEMRRVFAAAPETMVLIEADRDAKHGKVVQVMDAARQVGFERIGIAIEAAADDS